MRALIASVIAALLVIAYGPAVGAESGYGKQKVVYHINYDDPKKQKGALKNIQNHINAVGAENMDLRVVMHGNGLTLLMRANDDPNFESGVAHLKSQGIGFKVCANTLKGRKISYEDDLYDGDWSSCFTNWMSRRGAGEGEEGSRQGCCGMIAR